VRQRSSPLSGRHLHVFRVQLIGCVSGVKQHLRYNSIIPFIRAFQCKVAPFVTCLRV
jgi:hypothetical protein